VEPALTSEFKMLTRLSKKLTDGKLYYVFLFEKNKRTSSSDIYYLVTLRDVTNIDDIYDLGISLEMA
jgi:hypothetical protein